MDNVLKVNLVNFITIGLMAYLFIYILNLGLKKFFPMASVSGAPAAPSGTVGQVPAQSQGDQGAQMTNYPQPVVQFG